MLTRVSPSFSRSRIAAAAAGLRRAWATRVVIRWAWGPQPYAGVAAWLAKAAIPATTIELRAKTSMSPDPLGERECRGACRGADGLGFVSGRSRRDHLT